MVRALVPSFGPPLPGRSPVGVIMRRCLEEGAPNPESCRMRDLWGRDQLDKMSLHDPLFTTYVIAASLMILKAVSMAWLTVIRMMEVKGVTGRPRISRGLP